MVYFSDASMPGLSLKRGCFSLYENCTVYQYSLPQMQHFAMYM